MKVWILAIAFSVLLVFSLWSSFRLAHTRYFDIDEFAHLHWAARVAAGAVPYRDFLTFFPPGFHWMLAPVVTSGWGTTQVLVTGRTLSFIIFSLTVGAVVVLFWRMRRSVFAIFAGAIVVFLPIPGDKFLEIRPDTLSLFFYLVGILSLISLFRTCKARWAFFAGLLSAASLIVLTKSAPSILLSVFITVAWAFSRKNKHAIPWLFVGFLGPMGMLFIWFIANNMVGETLYSLFRLPVEANQISNLFGMRPDLFFNPNGIIYGTNGWGRELLTNHVIWIAGLLFGTYRFLTPFGKRVWEEVLVGSAFVLSVFLYVSVVPLKHVQYLIAVAPFVAIYAADLADVLWKKWKGSVSKSFIAVALACGVSWYLVTVEKTVIDGKLLATNAETFTELSTLFGTIPLSEYILDLDGRTIFYRDPYPACCIPFGQFAPFLSRPLPPLAQALEATKTKYIYQGKLERVKTLLPQDQEYIRRNFRPAVAGKTELLVR